MQYQVPQFIETEDKVVGPFTIRQFAYVGAAAVVSGICYFLLQTWLFAIVALVLLGGALALSFVKINGRPLVKVGLSAFNFYWKPQMYVWKSEHPVVAQRSTPIAVRELPPIAAIASGNSLHKSWENLQTGTPSGPVQSDRQFIEKKMTERYQIFQRESGERAAARRVDYR
ncbi:MAG TPA: PrgI family protein [Candidatus Paceibacterota bacterium]|nr:PrgI family protein [Candidatus Paceibacterota bacterium]